MSNKISDKTLYYDPSHVIFKILYKDIAHYLKRKRTLMVFLISVVILLVIAVVLKKLEISIFLVFVLLSLLSWYYTIDFNVRIKKVGIIYLPIAAFPFKDKAIIIDQAGFLPDTTFTYPFLPSEDINNANNIYNEIQQLIKKFTPVLKTDKQKEITISSNRVFQHPLKIYGQEFELISNFIKLNEIFRNAKINQVRQSFIHSNLDILPSLRKLATDQKIKGMKIQKVPSEFLKEEIAKIVGIMGKRENGEEEFTIDIIVESILKFLFYVTPRYHWTISHSIKEVEAKNLFRYMNYISFYSFNFYCPKCNEELLNKFYSRKKRFTGKTEETPFSFPPTTKMILIDSERGVWQCPLCNLKTEQPITIHRMDDELFSKVYDKLYEENKNERLKIYFDILNQKRNYIEKAENQFHTVIRENRTKKDQIKSKIRSVSADIRADSESIQSLYMLMAKYDRISKERIQEFEQEISDIKRTIIEETQKELAMLDDLFIQTQKEIDERLTEYENLERIEQKARDEIQERQLKALEGLYSVEAARGEREELFDRSNWNPFNWGYNIRRSFIKTVDKMTGKDEVTTAKKLHKIGEI